MKPFKLAAIAFAVFSFALPLQAGSLPERTDFKLKVLVPFVDANVKIGSTMDNWNPRPN